MICPAANLGAFETEKKAWAFFNALPAAEIEEVKECDFCGGWHVRTHPRGGRNDTRLLPSWLRAAPKRRKNQASQKAEPERDARGLF